MVSGHCLILHKHLPNSIILLYIIFCGGKVYPQYTLFRKVFSSILFLGVYRGGIVWTSRCFGRQKYSSSLLAFVYHFKFMSIELVSQPKNKESNWLHLVSTTSVQLSLFADYLRLPSTNPTSALHTILFTCHVK